MTQPIKNEVKIICATCGSNLDFDYEEQSTTTGVNQTAKVKLCDRCVRDTFDEAFKIMSDNAEDQSTQEDKGYDVTYTYDDMETTNNI